MTLSSNLEAHLILNYDLQQEFTQPTIFTPLAWSSSLPSSDNAVFCILIPICSNFMFWIFEENGIGLEIEEFRLSFSQIKRKPRNIWISYCSLLHFILGCNTLSIQNFVEIRRNERIFILFSHQLYFCIDS